MKVYLLWMMFNDFDNYQNFDYLYLVGIFTNPINADTEMIRQEEELLRSYGSSWKYHRILQIDERDIADVDIISETEDTRHIKINKLYD